MCRLRRSRRLRTYSCSKQSEAHPWGRLWRQLLTTPCVATRQPAPAVQHNARTGAEAASASRAVHARAPKKGFPVSRPPSSAASVLPASDDSVVAASLAGSPVRRRWLGCSGRFRYFASSSLVKRSLASHGSVCGASARVRDLRRLRCLARSARLRRLAAAAERGAHSDVAARSPATCKATGENLSADGSPDAPRALRFHSNGPRTRGGDGASARTYACGVMQRVRCTAPCLATMADAPKLTLINLILFAAPRAVEGESLPSRRSRARSVPVLARLVYDASRELGGAAAAKQPKERDVHRACKCLRGSEVGDNSYSVWSVSLRRACGRATQLRRRGTVSDKR